MDDATNGARRPQFPAPAQHGSIFNLSFDDVNLQAQVGNIGRKPLNGAMNFDELLKNVVSVDEAKVMCHNQNRSSSSSSSSSTQYNNQSVVIPQGETTTLEDFLARAGVFNPPEQPVMVNDQADWLQFQMGVVQQEQHHITTRDSNSHISESFYGNPIGNVVEYSENHQLAIPMASMTATSPEKTCRYSDEVKEKSIERRQRRMIKNRESAARSRERKQVLIF